IIHLVLARLPDAPAGTRGISLFLVPKFLVGDDGALGARNDVFCSGLEHKLGIHASPTCTMIYGDGFQGAKPGAIGWLIGEENKGLACMFTMMNNARLCVGMQGVAVAEAATQKAIAYANERRQGKAASYTGTGMAPIVHHPDVQRNLLTMKALTQIARAISYSCAHAIDMARVSAGGEAAHWHDRANLLTPLAKAFSTDIGVEVASLGLQVHGGMGFIEETGAAAFYRDARIAPIYEGTNGIQAIDLVMRKLPLGGGGHVHGFIDELVATAEAVRNSNLQGFGRTADALDAALVDLTQATRFLQELA
ncbi:MAG: acyl-CoA dehydrogenase, partial [Mesorhizobium sp.]